MSNITMHAKDALSASLGVCYATIGDNRYQLMNLKKIEVKLTKEKSEISILGQLSKGNKSGSCRGSGSCTMYYNQSVLRQMAENYQNTLKDTYFDIQITNEDPTSEVGRQTIILKDCNFDEMILAKIDVDSAVLEEDMTFTFEKFVYPETFSLLTGMLQ